MSGRILRGVRLLCSHVVLHRFVVRPDLLNRVHLAHLLRSQPWVLGGAFVRDLWLTHGDEFLFLVNDRAEVRPTCHGEGGLCATRPIDHRVDGSGAVLALCLLDYLLACAGLLSHSDLEGLFV